MPLLALGVPGSGTTAVMLAAFQLYGLQPGPLLFTQDSTLVWGLIASLYVSNALLLVLNLPLIGLWVRLLQVPRPLLFAAVLAFSTLGVYSLNNNLFDVVPSPTGWGSWPSSCADTRCRSPPSCWRWCWGRCSSRSSGGRWRSRSATRRCS